MKFRRWAAGFKQWRAYRSVLKRLRELEKNDPQVKTSSVSRDDLTWIGQGQTAVELLARACERYGDRPCLATRQPGQEYQAISYSQLWQRVLTTAYKLDKDGWVASGDLVGVCGFCSVEWVVADLACLCLGAVTVPLDSGISQTEFAHILSETGLSCLISEPEPLLRLAPFLMDRLSIRSVLSMAARDQHPAPELHCRFGWWDQLAGDRPVKPVAPRGGEDLFSVVYTSGSTGAPKGVMLTHARWTETLRDALDRAAVPRLTLGYLPLSHMAGRINLYGTLMGGGCTSLVSCSDMSTLLEDLGKARPTHLLLVPRVSRLLYQHFQHEMLKRGRLADLERMLADSEGLEVCRSMRRELLGGRLCFVHTGAAPTPPEVNEFLWRGLSVHVTDLYGSTEMGPVTVNGRVHDYVKYRLVDRPELGFTTADKPYPRGELAVRSPRATGGYFNNPKATEDLQHDGYLLTGDIVEERGPRQLVWLDRRQNVLRLSNGEFVNISRLEDLFASQSPFLEQVYLYGNAWHSYLLAVLVVNAAARGAAPDDPSLRDLIRQELARVAAKAGLRAHEVPRDFLVASEPFSQDNGLLSSANKLRRPQLKAVYGPRLETLYTELEERQRSQLFDPEMSVASKLQGAVMLALGLEVVSLGHSFQHLGGDSLAAVRLADLMHQSSGLELSVSDLLDPNLTLNELLNRAAGSQTDATLERVHGPHANWANAADFQALWEGPESEGQAATLAAPRVVLLTGANGFLGRFLALELAQRLPQGRVICLVRAKDETAAWQRMKDSYASRQGLEAFLKLDTRLSLMAGDLSRPYLDLNPDQWEQLSTQVDAIVHAGALVNHQLDYAQLFASNVLGTAELIKLARNVRPKSLHFISTVALGAGRYGRNPAREEESAAQLWPRRPLAAQPGSYAQGYVSSKWASEILLEQACRKAGLPVTIARCSLLLPHSQWPEERNHQDTLCRLLYGIEKTHLAPSSLGSAQAMDGLPVDLVATFLAELVTRESRGHQIYHVCNADKEGPSLDQVVKQAAQIWCCRALPPGEFWPAFRRSLAELPAQEQRLSPLPILERWEKSKGELRLDSTAFQARLAELCPGLRARIDETYLERVLLAQGTANRL